MYYWNFDIDIFSIKFWHFLYSNISYSQLVEHVCGFTVFFTRQIITGSRQDQTIRPVDGSSGPGEKELPDVEWRFAGGGGGEWGRYGVQPATYPLAEPSAEQQLETGRRRVATHLPDSRKHLTP